MKPNEAPKKVYLHLTTGNHQLNGKYYEDKPAKIRYDDKIIEYTRTDAFIEKAKKWFEEHFGNRLKWEITTYEFEDIQSMVEDFRKHVMEE